MPTFLDKERCAARPMWFSKARVVETHLDRIVQVAVATAKCRSALLEIQAYGFGLAAVEGIAQALRGGTGLKVEVSGKTVRLI